LSACGGLAAALIANRSNMPTLYCPICGYNLTGLPENRCPECGQAFNPLQLLNSARRPHSGFAATFVLVLWPPVIASILPIEIIFSPRWDNRVVLSMFIIFILAGDLYLAARIAADRPVRRHGFLSIVVICFLILLFQTFSGIPLFLGVMQLGMRLGWR